MNRRERKLLKLFGQLTENQQNSLLDFAEFLSVNRNIENAADESIPEPQLVERPQSETVVAAIKRLTASYPMLDRDKLFNETSMLMSQHVMQGREAEQVIDDLEALFKQHYELLLVSWGQDE